MTPPRPRPTTPPVVDPPAQRLPWPGLGLQWLFGRDRFETAALLSQERYPDGNDVLYIGTGHNFPDLLALASITQKQVGPILLVGTDSIPEVTLTEIKRLRPRRIVVVGGPNAVSDAVFEQLRALTGNGGQVTLRQAMSTEPPPLQRMFGPDRYSTAAQVAVRANPGGVDTVVLVTGEKFPDAMVAGALAATHDAAILLTPSARLSPWTINALIDLRATKLIVVGGFGAVSVDVMNAALAAMRRCAEPPCPAVSGRRITGIDRYATASATSMEFTAPVDTVYIAGGQAWPDGLGVMPLAQQDGSPVLLVQKDDIPDSTRQALERLQPVTIAIVGGPNVISESVIAELELYLRGGNPPPTRDASPNRATAPPGTPPRSWTLT